VTDTNVIKLAQPGTFTDSLTEILRNGARALLTQAVETEVADFLGRHADLKSTAGHQRIVRHGLLPEREIMTGIGPVAVRQPRVRDREAIGVERIRFSPSILPPYVRRTKSLEVLIPILYLKRISTGDFEEALAALLGKDAAGLSASTIGRLKDAWLDEQAAQSLPDIGGLTKHKDPSDAASKRLNRFLDDIGITDPRKVAHSLRHRAQDRLRAAGCP
jgi:transposase-like protein